MSKTFAGWRRKRHATSRKALNAAQDSYLLSSRTAIRYRDKTPLAISFPQQITHLTLHPGGVIETPHLAGRPDDTRRAGIRTDSYSANACCASPSQRSSALPSVTASSSAIQAPQAIYCATGCAASPTRVIRSVPHFATGSRSAVDQRRRRSACPASDAGGDEYRQNKRAPLLYCRLSRPTLLAGGCGMSPPDCTDGLRAAIMDQWQCGPAHSTGALIRKSSGISS